MASNNVFAMTLQMRNHATAQARGFRKEVESTTVASKRLGTQFGKTVKASRTSIQGLIGSMVSLRTLIIAMFAFRAGQKIVRGINALTDATSKQEEAEISLATALASSNNFTKENLDLLKRQASEMQMVVAVGDEVILQQEALLATYGMSAEEIKKLIPLIIDFSKAKKIDLKTTVDLAGKAYVGYFGTLSRYGLILDSNLLRQEKYSAFLEMIAKFEGTAAELARTYNGQLEIRKILKGDLNEQMGKFISQGVEEVGLLELMNENTASLIALYKEWTPVLVDLVAEGLEPLVEVLKDMSDFARSDEGLILMTLLLNELRLVFANLSVPVRLVYSGLSDLFHLVIFGAKAMGLLKDSLINLNDEGLGEAMDALEEDLFKKVEENWIKTKETLEGVKETYKDVFETTDMLFSPDGLERYRNKLDEIKRLAAEHYKDSSEAITDGTRNQENQNTVIQETIRLTESMARQFSLASRLEQEQTKFLLSKIQGMSAEDVGTLTGIEKSLISKQGVLKEAIERQLGEFAQKQLGLETTFLNEEKVEIEIDLTEDAKKYLKVNTDIGRNTGNRQMEIELAG